MRFLSLSNNKAAALMILALTLGGCSTAVTRMDTAEVKDLSGAWNDTDSQMVAAEMMQDVLSRDWIVDFKGEQKRKPAVTKTYLRRYSRHPVLIQTRRHAQIPPRHRFFLNALASPLKFYCRYILLDRYHANLPPAAALKSPARYFSFAASNEPAKAFAVVNKTPTRAARSCFI